MVLFSFVRRVKEVVCKIDYCELILLVIENYGILVISMLFSFMLIFLLKRYESFMKKKG